MEFNASNRYSSQSWLYKRYKVIDIRFVNNQGGRTEQIERGEDKY